MKFNELNEYTNKSIIKNKTFEMLKKNINREDKK